MNDLHFQCAIRSVYDRSDVRLQLHFIKVIFVLMYLWDN